MCANKTPKSAHNIITRQRYDSVRKLSCENISSRSIKQTVLYRVTQYLDEIVTIEKVEFATTMQNIFGAQKENSPKTCFEDFSFFVLFSSTPTSRHLRMCA